MNNYKVYVHINKINQKAYVGITKQSVQQRWRSQGQGYKNQQKFWRAIEKYGWDNFEHIVLYTDLTAEQAGKLEQELIIKYNSLSSGYNADLGGSITNHSPETLEKMRQSMLGKTHTQETKNKISDTKSKAIICIETKKIYKNAIEASKDTGADRASINKVCQGKAITAGNLHWRYADEEQVIREDKRLRPVVCITTGIKYSSIAEAARDTNSDLSNIKKVCDGKYRSTNNLNWCWEEDYGAFDYDSLKKPYFNKMAIEQYYLDTGITKEQFESSYEAGRITKTDPSAIRKCCKGKLKTLKDKRDGVKYGWRNIK